MYFDTHAHYDDDRFNDDRYEVLDQMQESGVGLILNPGCSEDSSVMAMELAKKYDFVYAAVGWHPQDADNFDESSPDKIRAWAKYPKVRAIGEVGLDYFYDGPDREVQKRVLRCQMELARELELPVIIHDREAHKDSMDIVKSFPGVHGVFHCYSGSVEMARELLDLGWYLSFTGSITFKKARKAPEVIRFCPMDRLMLETDSPYLAPEPHRGHRNDSRMLPFIAQVVAEEKGLSTDEVARITMENGKRFFGIE